jgi:hypothetical protein
MILPANRIIHQVQFLGCHSRDGRLLAVQPHSFHVGGKERSHCIRGARASRHVEAKRTCRRLLDTPQEMNGFTWLQVFNPEGI